MKRRQFLVAGAAVTVAGCSSRKSTGTRRATDSPTPTPAPQLSFNAVSPVTSRIDADQEIANYTTSGFGKDGNVFVAANAEVPVHDGEVDYSARSAVYDGDTKLETLAPYEPDPISSDQPDTHTVQFVATFAQFNRDTGEYRVEIELQDDVTGETVTERTAFLVNEPFTAEEVNLVSTDIPDVVHTGEQFTYTLTFENVSNRASSIVSPVSARFGEGEWQQTDVVFRFNLAPNSEGVYDADVTFEQTGNLQIRLDAIDVTYSFDIGD